MISLTIGPGGDLSREDFARLAQIAADANEAHALKDEQLQRIETTLELALMAVEQGPTEAQEATISRYRRTYRFAREPEAQADGTVTLVYIASNNAGQTQRVSCRINPDGQAEHYSAATL